MDREKDEGGAVAARELDTLTYTAESTFAACRRLYWWRYVREIVPAVEDDEPLRLGSLWHGIAEIRDTLRLRGLDRDLAVSWAKAWLARMTSGRAGDPRRRHWWLMLSEALDAYERAFRTGHRLIPQAASPEEEWPSVDFLGVSDEALDLVEVEGVAKSPIVNPETGAKSRSFVAGLKADVLYRARDDGRLYLGEKKLLSDLGDVERLWTDYQVARYARYLSRYKNESIAGVIYDVVVKPRIRIRDGREESVEAWRARVSAKVEESRAKLLEKEESIEAHSARVSAKVADEARKLEEKGKPVDFAAIEERVRGLAMMRRKEVTAEDIAKDEARVRELVSMQREIVPPETDDEFRARLRAHFDRPGSIVRIRIPISEERMVDAEEIAWESSQQILDARRRDKWRKNLASCFRWGRPCAMVDLCRDGIDAEDPRVAANYRREPANRELEESPMRWVLESIEAGSDPATIVAAEDSRDATVRGFFDGFESGSVDIGDETRKDAETVDF
jgi:hypothetical protein